jgi:hypothetical protein
MAFRFETAHERWSWHKNADNPAFLNPDRTQSIWDQQGIKDLWQGGIGSRFVQAIQDNFGVSIDDAGLQAIERLIYKSPKPGDEKYSEMAAFAREWLDSMGWTPEGYNWDPSYGGEHDEFPYRRMLPSETI